MKRHFPPLQFSSSTQPSPKHQLPTMQYTAISRNSTLLRRYCNQRSSCIRLCLYGVIDQYGYCRINYSGLVPSGEYSILAKKVTYSIIALPENFPAETRLNVLWVQGSQVLPNNRKSRVCLIRHQTTTLREGNVA